MRHHASRRRRIEKLVDADGAGLALAEAMRFTYDGQEIWADLAGGSSLASRYVRGDGVDNLQARVSAAGVVAWILPDRLGSTRDVADGAGAVQDTLQYDGFGNKLSESAAAWTVRYQWTGREFDAETGLTYNRDRYNMTSVGRWTRHLTVMALGNMVEEN